MKTVFIINPRAGKKNNIEKLVEIIESAVCKLRSDVEIYKTKCEGDATLFVRNFCKEHGKARFIACGGDGTLGEVLNGAIDTEGAEIGVIPIGTGNDFVKNFDKAEFDNIEAQILAESERCDCIRYVTRDGNGNETVGYCANMFNIGFDCNVADTMGEMKKKPFVSGSLAYFLAIFATLVKKKGADLEIDIDGETVHSGKLLLTSIANGCFCGGGIKSNPCACVHDGCLNVNIINNVSRFKFISLLPSYMKGTHMKKKNIEKVITNIGCKKLTIKPDSGTMRICADGEILSAGDTTFEILHDAFNFVVPR